MGRLQRLRVAPAVRLTGHDSQAATGVWSPEQETPIIAEPRVPAAAALRPPARWRRPLGLAGRLSLLNPYQFPTPHGSDVAAAISQSAVTILLPPLGALRRVSSSINNAYFHRSTVAQ